MKNTITLVVLIIFLFLSFGCARKEHFSFSNENKETYNPAKAENGSSILKSNSNVNDLSELPQPDSIIYTASISSNARPNAALFPRKAVINKLKTVEPDIKTLSSLVKQQVKVIIAEKASLRYAAKVAGDTKTPNALATIGFVLGLLALMALIAASATNVGILTLISLLAGIGGLITSKMGLSEIKRNPETSSGKGKAIAGLIMSIGVLVLIVLAVIILLSFLHNYN